MFTGIVEETGRVIALKRRKNLCVLNLGVKKVGRDLRLGESLAVNGVCLTVTKKKRGAIDFDIMQETIASTTLRNLKPGDRVNLERALTAQSRFGGHFVTGHVDGQGMVSARVKKPNHVELRIKPPLDLLRYVVPKGSICLDGVSLTVGKVAKTEFSVYLIPYTLKETTLGKLKAGDKINIETDILAKYLLGR